MNENTSRPEIGDFEPLHIGSEFPREPGADEGEDPRPAPPPRGEPRAPDSEPWAFADLAALAKMEPTPPQFIMRGLPEEGATFLGGHGGAGKSWVGLHLAICVALGLDFYGEPTKRKRTVFVSCEDATGMLHWRLHHICRSLDISISDLVGNLAILDLVGKDSMLYNPRGDGRFVGTSFGKLEALCEAFAPGLVILDGASHTFGGDEIKRAHVTAFANLVSSLAPAVIVIGHVAKDTAKGIGNGNTETYSGSTAWNNAFRARWALYPETEMAGDGEGSRPAPTGRLFLESQKGNYGGRGLRFAITWDEEARTFVGEIERAAVVDSSALNMRDVAERDGIMAALASVIAAGNYVPAATTGPRTAYHVLSATPGFPPGLNAGVPGRKRFWRHVEALRHSGAIREAVRTGSGRHPRDVLMPGTQPNSASPTANRVECANADGCVESDSAIASNAGSPAD